MSKPGPQNVDEIQIRQLRPMMIGAGMLHAGDPTKVLAARVEDQPGYGEGYDITWVRPRRAFRVDHHRGGKPIGSRWIPEASVADYEEW
jgi:hypothetical protein